MAPRPPQSAPQSKAELLRAQKVSCRPCETAHSWVFTVEPGSLHLASVNWSPDSTNRVRPFLISRQSKALSQLIWQFIPCQPKPTVFLSFSSVSLSKRGFRCPEHPLKMAQDPGDKGGGSSFLFLLSGKKGFPRSPQPTFLSVSLAGIGSHAVSKPVTAKGM